MGAGAIAHAVTKRPDRFRRLALVIPPTTWETRAAQSTSYLQITSVAREHGVSALTSAAASIPPLPIRKARGWAAIPPDIGQSIIADVMLGASDTEFPTPEAISSVQQPILLRPWVDDPSHPLATSERLHEVLPDSVLDIQRTPDDLRALRERIATLFS